MSDDPRLRIELEDTGEIWTRVTEYQIEEDFFTPADGWSATVFGEDPIALRRKFQPKTRVRLFLGDRLQLIGEIDKTSGVGGGSKALKLTGRDYMSKLVNPSVDKSIRITSSMTLADALLEGLRVFGITEVETNLDAVKRQKMGKPTYEERDVPDSKVRETFGVQPLPGGLSVPQIYGLVGYKPMFATSTTVADAKPQENEGAYEWASRLAARCGGTIQPGSKRSAIAVVVPDYRSKVAYALSRPGNVEEGVAERDYSGIPTVATLSSRLVTPGLEAKGQFKSLSIVGDNSELSIWRVPEARRILEAARAVGARRAKNESGDPRDWYCPVYYRDDEAKNEEQLNRSARRMMADRLRDTLTYTATLLGHDDASGTTYAINTLASVKDTVEDVDEVLWAHSRTLSYQAGERTTLHLIRPASYVL